MSKWTSPLFIRLVIILLGFLPAIGYGEEIEVGIAIDAIPVYAEPTSVSTVKIAQLKPGSEVILGYKHCTEREIQFLTHKGWVQDFSIVPITGERASPEKILAVARSLEQTGTPTGLEGAKALYTAVINYHPGTTFSAKAVEQMALLEHGYTSWARVASLR